jgi:hypothetical protein
MVAIPVAAVRPAIGIIAPLMPSVPAVATVAMAEAIIVPVTVIVRAPIIDAIGRPNAAPAIVIMPAVPIMALAEIAAIRIGVVKMVIAATVRLIIAVTVAEADGEAHIGLGLSRLAGTDKCADKRAKAQRQ